MKISYNWLKNYCQILPPAEKVSEILTDCGLEVESLHKFQSVKGGLEGMVVGEVKTKQQHPNADRLSVTTVDIGTGTDVQIVCGASNVAAGQKVIVATVGATLYPNDGASFQINKSKIRGEVSEGMICAEDEIGLGNSHEGIMVLEKSSKVGMPAGEYFKIENDIVFEIGLTPNRVDAASHIGVAKDLIAAINCKQNKTETITIPSVKEFKPDNNDTPVKIIIEDSKGCPRYSGLTITGIQVQASPEWLQNRLKAIDVKPINNVVDITNYLLHECGQPLHAFDVATIKGNKIVVRKAKEGEKFKTLDDVQRTLTSGDLMICNEKDEMCIAGVYGGANSGVKDTTNAVFLESAYFDPATIRKTSKHHNLKTDAAFRFERGTDPDATIYALKRAALLIKEIAGGEISSIIDIYPSPVQKVIIDFKYDSLDRLTGHFIERKTVKNILASLGIEILNENESSLKLSIPSNKVDVTREADVIEEVLRIYGFNNIPLPDGMKISLSHATKPDKEAIQHTVADYLSNNGFFEIMSTSLTKESYSKNTENTVFILNPLSQDLNILRQTLLYSGLEAINYNKNRRQGDLKLFEFGKSYHKIEGKYIENQHLALFVTGKKASEHWAGKQTDVDFFYLKGILQNLMDRVGKNILKQFTAEYFSSDIFTEGLSFSHIGKTLIQCGKIKPSILKTADISQDVYYADINWDLVLGSVSKKDIEYKEVSKFPAVRRDLSMLLDKKVQFSEVEKMAYQTERNLLKEVNLFDVYEGEKVEQGKKSYAVSFTLLDEAETLTDKRVDKSMERIMENLEKNLGATIRKS